MVGVNVVNDAVVASSRAVESGELELEWLADAVRVGRWRGAVLGDDIALGTNQLGGGLSDDRANRSGDHLRGLLGHPDSNITPKSDPATLPGCTSRSTCPSPTP